MKQGHAATPPSVVLRQIIPLTLQASSDNNYISGSALKTNLFSNEVMGENCHEIPAEDRSALWNIKMMRVKSKTLVVGPN